MPVTLDDVDALAKVDAAGMLRQMTALADQLERSLSSEVRIAQGGEKLCLCGLGGSAMGADVLCDPHGAELEGHGLGDTGRHPAGMGGPRYPGGPDLVLRQQPRETLSMYSEAVRRKAPVAVITSGGQLQKLSAERGDPTVMVPSGTAAPGGAGAPCSERQPRWWGPRACPPSTASCGRCSRPSVRS